MSSLEVIGVCFLSLFVFGVAIGGLVGASVQEGWVIRASLVVGVFTVVEVVGRDWRLSGGTAEGEEDRVGIAGVLLDLRMAGLVPGRRIVSSEGGLEG